MDRARPITNPCSYNQMKFYVNIGLLAILSASLFFNYKKKDFIDGSSLAMNQKFKSDEIDRGKLIKKVIDGDDHSAYALGVHYANYQLPEASAYWFRTALKLGNKSIQPETVDGIERSVLDEYR